MADKLGKAIADKGYRVRVYCPYGELIPGMSYLIRRLLETRPTVLSAAEPRRAPR
jgi:RHH-type proline utilization regulon transcriptional repressor/proline dehydrogenase/delta 1-pyrroline-5-carboxylate dehydrogenase